MLTVNWQHIILAASGYAGTSRRIARMRDAGAQFAPPYLERRLSIDGDIWSPTTPEMGHAPDSYTPSLLPADLYGDRNYVFAFWSINSLSGAGTPHRMVTDGRTPSIYIGGGPGGLDAKAWYVWDRNSSGDGGGIGEHGVEIDAFDWTNNDFLPNDFVDISPDGPQDPEHANPGPLTYTANEDGYVSTESLTEPITIKARGQFRDGNFRYQFAHWQVIHRFTSGIPMPEVNGSTITVHPQNTMKAYAIYGQVVEDFIEPKKVEDVLRPFAIAVGRDGIPILFAPPFPPIPPRSDDLRLMVEMLHRIENDLHKLYDF